MATKAKMKKRATRKTLRSILNELDRVLSRCTPLSYDLWNVLTALRGPDDGAAMEVKMYGTEPVRRAAFPRTARGPAPASFSGGVDGVVRLYDGDRSEYHFRHHLMKAAYALKLAVAHEPSCVKA